MKVMADADKLRREGVDVVDFSAGEPDFPTPDNIKRAAIAAIEANFTKYTPAGGTAEAKQAVVNRHKAEFGTDYKPSECIITVGGKHVLFEYTQALVNPGDEVIIPVPYWVTYKDIVNYAGGKCVFVETDEREGFALTAAMVERHITPKTKIVIINSPQQPVGRGDPGRGVREALSHYGEARHFPADGRMLLALPLRRQTVFGGVDSQFEANRAGGRDGFENLRDDGLANRLRAGAGSDYRRDDETAEPLDFEPDFDCPESSDRGAERAAGFGSGDAGRVPAAARFRGAAAARDSRVHLFAAAPARFTRIRM